MCRLNHSQGREQLWDMEERLILLKCLLGHQHQELIIPGVSSSLKAILLNLPIHLDLEGLNICHSQQIIHKQDSQPGPEKYVLNSTLSNVAYTIRPRNEPSDSLEYLRNPF